jgi:hypothetical protein
MRRPRESLETRSQKVYPPASQVKKKARSCLRLRQLSDRHMCEFYSTSNLGNNGLISYTACPLVSRNPLCYDFSGPLQVATQGTSGVSDSRNLCTPGPRRFERV